MGPDDQIERYVEFAMQRWRAARDTRRNRSEAWRARHSKTARAATKQKPSCNRKCGALTRRRTGCIRPPLENGRCRNHGGLSTGPKSQDGRARIAAAQRRRWAAWRRDRQSSETSHKISENPEN